MLRQECGKLSSIFQKSYDGNLGDSTTEARRATIGTKYDGSEARNRRLDAYCTTTFKSV
jgi:hypothetical protein